MLYPLTFKPLFKERVWGGRRLQELYQKPLPPGQVIGESWEIADRPGDVSLIANGRLAGKSLRWLMEHHCQDLFGETVQAGLRFPLLLKILDAQQTLSLQVHPPAAKAPELGGEPKTEMWYVAHADPGAELFVGLKKGVSRGEFEQKIRTGKVEECFHRLPVRPGDAMFLPSGRVHALGAGLVIFEIQQNSDTTYRVFDWNRVGLDGKPRALHIRESLASIDFNDFEPGLTATSWKEQAALRTRNLVAHDLFSADLWQMTTGAFEFEPGCLQIICMVEGSAVLESVGEEPLPLRAGQFCLLPACLTAAVLRSAESLAFLLVRPGPPARSKLT